MTRYPRFQAEYFIHQSLEELEHYASVFHDRIVRAFEGLDQEKAPRGFSILATRPSTHRLSGEGKTSRTPRPCWCLLPTTRSVSAAGIPLKSAILGTRRHLSLRICDRQVLSRP